MGRLGKFKHNKNTASSWTDLNPETENTAMVKSRDVNNLGTTKIRQRKQSKAKKDREIEARRIRRAKKKVCLNCRKPGHLIAGCTEPVDTSRTDQTEEQIEKICYKCGSTEHTSKTCKQDVAKGEFPFAKCFICKETGHLSSKCPDNPRGLYPLGGGCKFCGSVEHFRKDCPERDVNKVKASALKKLSKFTTRQSGESADAIANYSDEEDNTDVNALKRKGNLNSENYDIQPSDKKEQHNKKKIVKF